MGILDIFRGSRDVRIARELIETLRRRGESRRMKFDEASGQVLAFDDQGDRVASWSIGNLKFELERADESAHDEIYERYAHGLTEDSARGKTYADARPWLRVMMKDDSYPAFIELMHRVEHPDGKTSPLVWRRIAGDVVACCVLESEHSLHFVSRGEVEEWGVTPDQALDDAIANVRGLTIEFGGEDEVRYINDADSFISSRLVCEDAIRALALPGRMVAVLPDRDTLFFAGSDDEAGLAALARLIENQLKDANRHISGRPLVLTEQGWQPFTPPESLRLNFGNLARQFDAMYWNEYKALLEKDYEARDEDVFVGTLAVYEHDDRPEYFTTIAWTRGADSVFPPADRVHFFDPADDSLRVADWNDVQRVMGSEMTFTDDAPRRFRVNTYPTADQFLAMGAKRVPKKSD
jgi:hypothetical protein